ncbi:hypothetical protein GG681_06640 [Epibacterium sp. SM1969]|uniref:Transmembrane protein n=1 Tax=Tritonibacter aquimaris TaxID=2663379 RepID=A0A844AP13_9RHOB|nr:TIGR02186 family protein [Tritonibacter aquimaris]MQY42313.1 hypothetical protein [Tritonibacter aquimaris]
MIKPLLVAAALLMALPVQAKESVVLGLSQNSVEITTDFDGSDILIFGAIKREIPIPDDSPLEVIVTLSGPSLPAVVRRKDRRFGIWTNVESVEIDRAPIFYAVATSAPFDQMLSASEDRRHRVSIERAILSIGAKVSNENAETFQEALVRVREEDGKYVLLENTVDVDQQTLFRTTIQMPPDLTEGAYTARILLTREAQVVAAHSAEIEVRKVGLERFLFNLSREQPWAYGVLALVIAALAGWGASAIFSLLRNR